jgi:acyl carrier protein
MSDLILNSITNSITNSMTKQTYSVESIQEWLVAQVAEQLSLDPDAIDVHTPLDSYGLASMQVMIIASRAEKQIGMQIPLLLLLHYPTIAALSQRLAEDLDQSEMEVFQL